MSIIRKAIKSLLTPNYHGQTIDLVKLTELSNQLLQTHAGSHEQHEILNAMSRYINKIENDNFIVDTSKVNPDRKAVFNVLSSSIQNDQYTEKEQKLSKQYDLIRAIKLPEQRSPEWFSMRRDKITASDGGVVLGKNHYEPQFGFITKKVDEPKFTSNIYCYHGKKYEEIATMIYSKRMDVTVDEFGLLGHPTIHFLGASPDGICNQYKFDKKTKSKMVGRMLEIKCPKTRVIKTEGEIIDNICPIYYWIQVQLQLECCDLDECDFWQCDIKEYENKDKFLEDTDPDLPDKSKYFGYEKGAVIQLLPLTRQIEASKNLKDYNNVVYEDAKIIYPPKIDMTPLEYDIWISDALSKLSIDYKDFYFDKVLYWRLEKSHNVTINRDKKWFNENLPTFEKVWNYVVFFRNNSELYQIWKRYINALNTKINKKIMTVAEFLSHPEQDDFVNKLDALEAEIATLETEKERKQFNFDKIMFDDNDDDDDGNVKPVQEIEENKFSAKKFKPNPTKEFFKSDDYGFLSD